MRNDDLILPSGAPMFPKEPESVEEAPKPSDYWKVDVPEMERMVTQIQDDSYILYLTDAETVPWKGLNGEEGVDPGAFTASIKWDGCVDLIKSNPTKRITGEEEEPDYYHICNLEDFIERLIALQTIAKTYFENRRGEWPG